MKKELYELVRNLNLSNVTDYTLVHGAIKYSEEAKYFLREYTENIRLGILALTDRYHYVPTEKIETFLSENKIRNMIPKETSYGIFCLSHRDDSYSVFASNRDIESSDIKNDSPRMIRGRKELLYNDVVFHAGMMFLQSSAKVEFLYKGHQFVIKNFVGDNEFDEYLMDMDNPHSFMRAGFRLSLFIDGEKYEENINHPRMKGKGFQSWRKWIGYEDCVTEETF